MKRKIYWLFPHLEQDGGGTKFLLEVTKRLARTYTITIICNTGKKEIIDSFQKNGSRVITTSYISANSNFYWLFMPFFIFFDFFSYARHLHNADFIIATMYPSNFLAYLYSLFYKKHYYYYCYEPFPYLQNKKFIRQQPLLKRVQMTVFATLYSWTDIIVVKQAHIVLTLNEITQKMISQVYHRPSVVTYMGVDTSHFRHYPDSFVTKKYKNNILIAHSTDYSKMKRTDLAIRAIKRVAKEYPSILLLITSTYPDSPNKKICMSLVNSLQLTKNVLFLDYLSYADVPKYYSAALCYLSCSYDDMLGTTSSNLPVKEALSCETPAIRANITHEDVVNGRSGFLVDPRKSQEVAAKIVFFIRNKRRAKAMGIRGRKFIKERYSWDKVYKIIADSLTAV